MSARTYPELDLVPSRELRLSTERNQPKSLVLASAATFAVIALAGLQRPEWRKVDDILPTVFDVAPPPMEPAPPAEAMQAPPRVDVPNAPPVVVPDAPPPPQDIRVVDPGLANTALESGKLGSQGGRVESAPPCADCGPPPDPGVQFVDTLPVELSRVEPVYPEFAREAGIDGTVALWALVGRDGRVQEVRILQSSPLFDESARNAVSRWRFIPASTNGSAVRAWVAVRVHFSLH